MKKQGIALIPFLLLSCFLAFAQKATKKTVKFQPISPIDTALYLAGSFGEIRLNHFHTGIDIRTAQREGWTVRAAETGSIKRIKVSAFGNGKTIYLEHPSGYTTVYAHLQQFEPALAAWVKQVQYSLQTFEIDTVLPKPIFHYQQGATIALSGNSGGSNGPHLHFEIRDSKTEEIINPAIFGLALPDVLPPSITFVEAYSYPKLETPGNHDKSTSKDTVRLTISGPCYQLNAAIQDAMSIAGKENIGPYEVSLIEGLDTVYQIRNRIMSFDEGRYANEVVDYHDRKINGIDNYKFPMQAGIDIHQYRKGVRADAFCNTDSNARSFKLYTADFNGNSSSRIIQISTKEYSANKLSTVIIKDTVIKSSWYTWEVPARAQAYNAEISCNAINYKTMLVALMPQNLSFPKNTTLSFPRKSIPHPITSQIVLLQNDYNMRTNRLTTRISGDDWVATIRETGTVYYVIDSVAPELTILSDTTENFKAGDTLFLKCKDVQGGIKSYKGLLDSTWHLMEYEAKKDQFWFFIPAETKSGRRLFTFYAEDNCGNIRKQEFYINIP